MKDEKLYNLIKKYFPMENIADARIIGKKIVVQIY
jgi:hypothetical protein